jgi:outer membrane protein
MKHFAAALGAVLLTAMLPAEAQTDLKIGFVNISIVLQESPQTLAVNDQLAREFAPREAELRAKAEELQGKADVLERDQAVMTQQEVASQTREIENEDRDFQRQARTLQEDLEIRRDELLTGLQQSLGNRIRAFAEENDYDVILSNVVYVSDAIDITVEVLEYLEAEAAED